jgi:hypothetical protein
MPRGASRSSPLASRRVVAEASGRRATAGGRRHESLNGRRTLALACGLWPLALDVSRPDSPVREQRALRRIAIPSLSHDKRPAS